MGEEFHAIIKLISGEEILSSVCIDEDSDEPIILLHHPVVMKMINSPQGSFIKVRSWIELASDDMFVLRNDKIITMTEVTDKKIIAVYITKMGQISNAIRKCPNKLRSRVNLHQNSIRNLK